MPLIHIDESTTRHEGGVEFGGGRLAHAPGEATVAEAMVHRPKLLPPAATGRDVGELFLDDHVHAVLVCDGERLLTVIERQDLTETGDDEPATSLGTLKGRTVAPGADLWSTWTWMRDGRRPPAGGGRGRSLPRPALPEAQRPGLLLRRRCLGAGPGAVRQRLCSRVVTEPARIPSDPTPHHRS